MIKLTHVISAQCGLRPDGVSTVAHKSHSRLWKRASVLDYSSKDFAGALADLILFAVYPSCFVGFILLRLTIIDNEN